MREIKFRAWDKSRKEMVTFELKDLDCGHIPWAGQLDDMVLIQYTGLKDKNGKEIYEGDVVAFDDVITADDTLGIEPNGYIFGPEDREVVAWDEETAGWAFKWSEDEEWKYRRDSHGLLVDGMVEVIGNRFENPELLETS